MVYDIRSPADRFAVARSLDSAYFQPKWIIFERVMAKPNMAMVLTHHGVRAPHRCYFLSLFLDTVSQNRTRPQNFQNVGSKKPRQYFQKTRATCSIFWARFLSRGCLGRPMYRKLHGELLSRVLAKSCLGFCDTNSTTKRAGVYKIGRHSGRGWGVVALRPKK
jgi:hypothetical protein